MGWVGSDALREALGDAACGCDLLERADSEPDPRGAAVLRSDAAACQQEWRCPRAGGRIDPEALGEGHRAALDRVRQLCGAGEGELLTCPGHYTRDVGAHRVVTALRWLRAGALHLRDPHPSAALVDALDLAQNSLADREHDELERARRKQPKGGDHGNGR